MSNQRFDVDIFAENCSQSPHRLRSRCDLEPFGYLALASFPNYSKLELMTSGPFANHVLPYSLSGQITEHSVSTAVFIVIPPCPPYLLPVVERCKLVYDHDRPSAQSFFARLTRSFANYSEILLHKALRMRSPREFIRSVHQPAANCAA